MPRILTPDAELLRWLPLPLAQLYDDACHAKNPRDRHDHAYFLWELGLKLLAMVAVTEARRLAGTTSLMDETLKSLARPSVGHWWAIVRGLYPTLMERDPDRFAGVGGLLAGRDLLDGERLRLLRSRLRAQLRRREGDERSGVRLDDLFDMLVTYRNRFMGHNVAVRRPSEVLRQVGDEMLLGLAELYGHLDPLVGGRLVYIESVTAAGGRLEVKGFLLQGTRRLAVLPQTIPRSGAGHLDGRRVFLAPPTGPPLSASLRSLHPLLYYKAEEDTFWFLNSRPSERRAELICCTNGDYQVLTLDPPATTGSPEDPPLGCGIVGREDEMRQLADDHRLWLAETFQRPIDWDEFESWADAPSDEAAAGKASQAEERDPAIRVGDYELISTIAQAGFSSVHRARQLSLDREVALKVQRNVGAIEEEKRFVREIRALGRIVHPSLARIYNSGLDDQRFYYVMELVEGPTLQHVWNELRRTGDEGPWIGSWHAAARHVRSNEKWLSSNPPREGGSLEPASDLPSSSVRPYHTAVADWFAQVASAAHCLHQANLVHRDIKPSNIILTTDAERAVLVDLGSARDLTSQSIGAGFVGTIRYAAPEQLANAQLADARSDVYSLGMVLWEALTLCPAFEVEDPQALSRLISTKDLPIPHTIRPGVPIELEAIALKCVARDPERRYPTAEALAVDLHRYLKGEDVQAPLPTTWYRVRRWTHHRRTGLAASLLVLVLLTAACLATWRLTQSGEDPMVTLKRGEIERKVVAKLRAAPVTEEVSPHPITLDGRSPGSNLGDFQILEDYREVDLRGWSRLPPGAPSHAVAYTSSRRLRLAKRKDVPTLWLEGRTSGTGLVVRCLSPNPQAARVFAAALPVEVGKQAMLSRFLGVDVHDKRLDEEFDVSYVMTYWNALQHPDEQWFGVIGYNGSYKVSMLMLFPHDRPYQSFELQVAEAKQKPQAFTGRKIVIESRDHRWLYWEVPEPESGHVYQVRWTWSQE